MNKRQILPMKKSTRKKLLLLNLSYVRGAQVENYIHELQRYIQQQSGVSDNIFPTLNILSTFIEKYFYSKTNKNERFSTFIENNVYLTK